ncbi:MAG: molybdopterin biosynthesis protein [Desulfovibrionaceae bacterium]|nr:molybdopterin biosynthesis protein [Desulfovibrionaceae bacterium]
MKDRNIYLQTIPAAEAVSRAIQALDREALIGTLSVPTHLACGRVTSAPVLARCSSPTFHSAAMDGIAVRAQETFSAREDNPLTLKRDKGYKPINTGQPMPKGMDAVVMIEDVIPVDEKTVRIEAPVFPWRNVRRIGEDIVATELIVPQNRTLSAYDVGALLSAGVFEVQVLDRVRLAFIPTGDEVLDFEKRPSPKAGEVIESNSQVFCCLARSWGAEPVRLAPAPDDPEAIALAVSRALDSDVHVVIVGAGSSAGTRDYTRKVFEKIGRVLVHGISTMPGKPTLLGEARGKLLVGAPGYPVSSVVCFEEVLAPVAAWLGHRTPPERRTLDVRLTRKTPSKLGLEEILRLAVGRVGNSFVAVPLGRGAGMISTLTKAQAITRVPANSEGLDQDQTVKAELLVPEKDLDSVLVHVGSHDNILDLMANEFMALPEPVRLVSSHVGSMGGLTAIKNGAAMFAGSHLFDPETGDFNFPFIERYLPGIELLVVNLAIRHQGLIVARENPKAIMGVKDLTRQDVVFINRQRGAGTRILLDHHLELEGVDPSRVRGYGQEEYTHMAVAVNVLTGAADCGLGIFAAAKALGLDFVPLAHERYDLIIPRALAGDAKIEVMLDLLRSKGFKDRIDGLGGYETRLTGRVMEPGQGLS